MEFIKDIKHMEAVRLVHNDGAIHEVYTHYLVALTFIPLPTGATEDDVFQGRIVAEFIDGNTRNKHAANLRWITRTADNMKSTVPFLDRVVYCGANTSRIIKKNKPFRQ